VIIGCFGGGSNFGGIALPYVHDRLNGSAVRLLAVEPLACPSLTKGAFAYDFGDTAKFTPLVKMFTLGHDFIPANIHAGDLRYHGASPLASHLVHHGMIKARAYPEKPVFDAALQFARTEGVWFSEAGLRTSRAKFARFRPNAYGMSPALRILPRPDQT
jgi:tryptophan synthase beta chain